ncbi:MAG: outer membrane beta-barrel protein [Rikenellaceae bacterium]
MVKKVIVSLLVMVVLGVSTNRAFALGLNYGFGVGTNISSIKSLDEDISIGSGWGYQIGAHAGIDLAFMGVTAELWYSGINASYDAVLAGSNSGTLKVKSIDVPILASVSIFGPLKIKAGPSFSLWSNATLPNGMKFNNVRSTYGYVAGIGLDFMSISIDLRYNGQFSSTILPLGVDNPSISDPSIRANSCSIIMSYSF